MIRSTIKLFSWVFAFVGLFFFAPPSEAQEGAGQVTFSAGVSATLVSAHSYTKTFGQHAVVGLSVLVNSGGSAAEYTLTGDGA